MANIVNSNDIVAHVDNCSLAFPDDFASTIWKARASVYVIGTLTVMKLAYATMSASFWEEDVLKINIAYFT